MPAHILQVDASSPDPGAMARAAEILMAGGLVAFPTETVYGLAANALDATAVAKIFAAKGRPARNPIIVHVGNVEAARNLASAWPSVADRLAARFWPGPLTLVMPKRAIVPDVVCAGGRTVGLRVPAHPVALALLRACGLPLAAPSANTSTALSPTCAEHVLRGLGDSIDLILDAGPTPGGLESTVIDVTCVPPRLLRPGLVTRVELEDCIGSIEVGVGPAAAGPLRSPGQMHKHYAPSTSLELATDSRCRVEMLAHAGERVGWLSHRDEQPLAGVLHVRMPADAVSYSAKLYAALHELDDAKLDRIVVEMPPDGDAWLAVHDRLRRAASEFES